MNIFIELTRKFNTGKLRAIISSGQAVVLHRLIVVSKDGDWIIREDSDTTNYIIKVLAGYGAKYRFGAPLDIRWLAGGWSSHLEFQYNDLRIRTDFVTRPPRISKQELDNLWERQEGQDLPFLDVKTLAEIKKTNREKDYVVIGELARLMSNPKDQLLYSRSAGDLAAIGKENPNLVSELVKGRPLLKYISKGITKLETALDAERRDLMHKNEERLQLYMQASQGWLGIWSEIQEEIADCNLEEAHKIMVNRASSVLPTRIKDIK